MTEKKGGDKKRIPIEEASAEELAEHLGNLHREGMGGKQSKKRVAETLKGSDPKVIDAYIKGRSGMGDAEEEKSD